MLTKPTVFNPICFKLILVCTLLLGGTKYGLTEQCDKISVSSRLDCHPEAEATQQKCSAKGCCWAPKIAIDPGIPMCFFPEDYPTYHVETVQKNGTGFTADLIKDKFLFGTEEFKKTRLEVIYETESRLRVRFTIPSQSNRWEPPIWLDKPEAVLFNRTQYDVELQEFPFGLRIYRKNPSRTLLLDSSEPTVASSTILSDQFLQTTFRLNAHRGFGIGEVRNKYPRSLDQWLRIGLWARDTAPVDNTNLYGLHNMFLGMDYDGSAFGIFFLNSNAQEIELTPLPAITYRTIGGILDFFILTGPTPMDVIGQYYQLIGHPPIPPYWSLGYHLCRYGYRDVDEVAETVKRNLDAGIPIDAQWFDIDYMEAYKSWSLDPVNFAKLPSFVRDTLHAKYGMRSVLMVDPAISTQGGLNYLPYHSGLKLGLFINDSQTNRPILGTVWPGETVFPDFSHPNAEKWWYDSASQYHESVPFDGIWIDMNEPASFNWGSTTNCATDNKLDNPPYIPPILDRALHAKTLCPSALHYDTTHYNRHNLYGYEHAKVTNAVMKRLFPGKRPFIVSRSTFAGSGRFTFHWSGDNWSNWANLRDSVAQTINFNMYGIPMVGADVCGFLDDTTEELCIRWHQLGAFYPFYRNHNALGSVVQDPAVWSEKGIKAIGEAIRLRYLLLPYLYSLLFRAHLHGEPVIRALAFEFPKDLTTHSNNRQLMMGSCILVTPVLDESRTVVEGYVPEGDWINLSTGRREYSKGETMYFQAPLNVIPVLVRGGCVLPMQKSQERTSISRSQGIIVFAVLSEVDDGSVEAGRSAKADGELFWDDGDSDPLDYVRVTFSVANRTLQTRIIPSNSTTVIERLDQTGTSMRTILICGLTTKPKKVSLNGNPINISYDEWLHTLSINCSPEIRFTEPLTLSWSFD